MELKEIKKYDEALPCRGAKAKVYYDDGKYDYISKWEELRDRKFNEVVYYEPISHDDYVNFILPVKSLIEKNFEEGDKLKTYKKDKENIEKNIELMLNNFSKKYTIDIQDVVCYCCDTMGESKNFIKIQTSL